MNLLTTMTIVGFATFYSVANTEHIQKNLPVLIQHETKEMIVSFENLHPKNEQDLIQQFSALEGIEYVGRCPEANIFFFHYETEKHETAQAAFEVLTLATKDYQPLLKIGSSIAQVQGACLK